jgi:uncharacterized lipoprotein YddW (UPF0748 family)
LRPTSTIATPGARALAGLLLAWAAAAPARGHELPPPPPPLGLWVLAEGSQRVLENPERIDGLVADARALGATHLFVQVYRRGVTWWPSEHARPAEAWAAARAEAPDRGDPLARLLTAAHGAGLEVHAWVNLLSLADNAEAALVEALGPGVLQVDRKGRSVLDYPERELPEPDAAFLRMGTPALWVDPAAPGVTAWYRALVAELFARYPALDGLHLDYVRYPDVLPFSPGSRFGVGLDFGYGEATRQRFHEATGAAAPFGDEPGDPRGWDDWRRGQLTALVAALRDEVRRASPDAALSAAVIAWPSRAYLSLYQDWLGWVDDGVLDFAVAMLYTRDPRLLRQTAAAYAGGLAAPRVWAGLGSWLFADEPEGAVAQLREVERLGVAGRALFSWDAIAASPALRSALAREAARVPRR